MKKFGRCPLCNGRLREKKGSVVFPLKSRKVEVKNLHYLECAICKEKLFSHDAQQIIEGSVYQKKKRRAA